MPPSLIAEDQLEIHGEPDATVDEICRRTLPFDLKLDFNRRTELARLLREYEMVMKEDAARRITI
jgi:hypothetical protein